MNNRLPRNDEARPGWWERFRWPLLIGVVALATVGLLALLTNIFKAIYGAPLAPPGPTLAPPPQTVTPSGD